MATTVDRYSIEVDIPGIQSLNRLQNKLGSVDLGFKNLSKSIGQLAVGAFVIDTIRSAKALDDFSKSSGIALDSLMGFTKAIKLSGANQDQAIDSIGQFNAKLKEAANGGKEAQVAFAKVGISLNDLRSLTGEQLLGKSFAGLSKNTDDVSRLGQQMGLFGESFRIVDTSVAGVVNRLDEANKSAKENASNVKSAADAYRSFQAALSTVADVALMLIKPISDLVAAISIKTETVAGILKLGAAFLVLSKVINPLTALYYNFATAALVVGAKQLTLVGIFGALLAPVRMLGVYMATTAAQSAIMFEIWAVQGVSAASKLAISLGALAAVASRLAVLVVAIVAINEAIKGLANVDPIDTMANKLYDLSNSVSPGLTKWFDELGKKIGLSTMEEIRAKKAAEDTGKAIDGQVKPLRDVQDAWNAQRLAIQETSKAFSDQNKNIIDAINLENSLIGKSKQYQDVVKAQEEIYKRSADEVNKLRDAKAKLSDADKAAGIGAEYDKQIAKIQELAAADAKRVETVLQNSNRIQAAEQVRLFGIQQQIDYTRELTSIQDDMAKIGMTSIEKKYYDIEAAAKASAKAAIDSEVARRGAPMDATEQAKYYNEARKGVASLQAAEQSRYDAGRTWSVGWKQAFIDYSENAANSAKTAESAFKTATQGMEDAIVNFAKTGKFEWKGFISSVLEELLRSQIQQLIAQTFGGIGGSKSAGGGSMILGGLSSLKNILGFANGGTIPTNNPVIVGERGPEILSGAAGRTVTPNNMLGGSNITYNINAVDAPSFKAMIAADPTFLYAVSEQGRRRLPGAR